MIRKLLPEDLDRVMTIWLNANKEAHPFIEAAFWEQNAPLVKELLPQAEVWVYEAEGEIAGFIGLMDDYIAGLFVDASRRSGGLGSSLLEHCKQQASSLTLKVYVKNEKAVAFYKRNGFSVAEELANEETGGEMEFLMQWKAELV